MKEKKNYKSKEQTEATKTDTVLEFINNQREIKID